jgi:hypothetical protein
MRLPRVINAKKRLGGTHFDLRSENVDHTIHFADYTCPACDFVVRFTSSDLFRQPSSPFTSEQLDLAERARPLNKSKWERAFDFFCPQCDMPIRIVASPGESYAMGGYNWDFVSVIELIDN